MDLKGGISNTTNFYFQVNISEFFDYLRSKKPCKNNTYEKKRNIQKSYP